MMINKIFFKTKTITSCLSLFEKKYKYANKLFMYIIIKNKRRELENFQDIAYNELEFESNYDLSLSHLTNLFNDLNLNKTILNLILKIDSASQDIYYFEKYNALKCWDWMDAHLTILDYNATKTNYTVTDYLF